MEVFIVSDERQGSNHIKVSRKEFNGNVGQVALHWVAGWYSDMWAKAQLPMEASKFNVTWAWCLDFHCCQSYFGCHWTEQRLCLVWGKSQPKSPCMILSSDLIQLPDHRNLMSLEMPSMIWQIWHTSCRSPCPSGRKTGGQWDTSGCIPWLLSLSVSTKVLNP